MHQTEVGELDKKAITTTCNSAYYYAAETIDIDNATKRVPRVKQSVVSSLNGCALLVTRPKHQ